MGRVKANARDNEERTSTEYMRVRRRLLDCSFCRPHRSENASRRPAHGKQKPRSKNKGRP